MINMFRFRSNDTSKSITLMPDTDSQVEQVVEMIQGLNTEYPELDAVSEYADQHDIQYEESRRVIGFYFQTKNPSEAVVMFPKSFEQLENVLWMLKMWEKNNLGNCGTCFAEEFAKFHRIKYGIVEPM